MNISVTKRANCDFDGMGNMDVLAVLLCFRQIP